MNPALHRVNPIELALPHVRALNAYVPGDQPEESNWIKLNTNELPYPCSPRVAAAVSGEVAKLPLYPNPRSLSLRKAIAAQHGLGANQVIVGNGSDDILNLLVRVFCDAKKGAAMTSPSYSLYPALVAIRGADTLRIPFAPDMALPVEAILAAQPRILFLTTPNAPTGVAFSNAALAELISRLEGMVVADEAYVDFAEDNAVPLLARFPNLVVTRTFSKSYGLAGLRVGYGLGHPEVIELLDRVRDSYNVNRLSQAGALAALEDRAYFDHTVGLVKATRDRFVAELVKRDWFCYPSSTNFVFTRPRRADGSEGPEVAQSLFEFLRCNRILVRYFPGDPLTAPYLRISIGTDQQMNVVSQIIESWLQTD